MPELKKKRVEGVRIFPEGILSIFLENVFDGAYKLFINLKV